MDDSSMVYFVGVDVGTGSVRAALVSASGRIAKSHSKSTRTWNVQPDFYEQSTDDIWAAVVHCVTAVLQGVDPAQVRGVGFDATCSLACLDCEGRPLTVSPSGRHEQNVILWLDHRAVQETAFINGLGHPVLRYVGGKIFPEMETPKLLWLKRHLPATWATAGHFFDLPDFLTWRATGCESRSSCSLVCKWAYEMTVEGGEGWDPVFFEQIGLEDLAQDGWSRIGALVQPPGAAVGTGLSKQAAAELGLRPGTAVGTSMIDAHAGGLGLLGCQAEGVSADFETRLGLICGTSTCHMAVSREAVFAEGVWGPYKSAMVPGMWLNEGGQSATGKLLDHVIDTHPAAPGIRAKLPDNAHIVEYLNELLQKMGRARRLPSPALLTRHLHVYPDFHGNRLLGDPTLKGMVSGLTLASDEESLALLYLATVQALSYGTRQILERLRHAGYARLQSTLICGGLSKNPIFTAAQADVCNLPVVCPLEVESVLLGAAILGAVAARHFDSVEAAVRSMGGTGTAVHPDAALVDFHDRKYRVFLQMHQDQQQYRRLMIDGN